MQIDFTCNTAGDGLWSDAVAAVRCTKLSPDSMHMDDETIDDEWGELRVYFDVSTWDVKKLGLIYTDDRFEAELRQHLMAMGFSQAAANDVGYSEQGMQGRDYVSFDIGHAFLAEYRRISKEPVEPSVV